MRCLLLITGREEGGVVFAKPISEMGRPATIVMGTR